MDSIIELRAGDGLNALAEGQRNAVWALDDAFRTPVKGDAVCVQGLASEAGQALNGKRGVVVGFAAADNAAGGAADGGAGDGVPGDSKSGVSARRCRVRIDVEVKSILPCHLKTAGGIFRTNQFADGEFAHLFATLARFNHACGASANVARGFVDGPNGERVVGVVCTRAVPAGGELLIDYMPEQDNEGDVEERRRLLKLRYNFHCTCDTCAAQQAALERAALEAAKPD
jgi:hypothetical protein